MNIDNRLKRITDFIPSDSYILDVGCDHAFLDIYLALNRKNVKLIASDINENPLKKAQEKDSKKEIIKTKEHVLLKFLIVGILMVIVSIFLTLIVNLIADKNPNVASSFIGAILLGITTSMPEVITFIALIKMKSFDLALSDIIGSNLFNLLILAIGDIFLKNKEIYYFVDKESMFLLVFGFILTILSFYQNNRKVVKNKLIYIVPSLIGVLLYIYYIVINV